MYSDTRDVQHPRETDRGCSLLLILTTLLPMGVFFIAQPREEFDARVADPVFYHEMNALWGGQGLVIVLTHLGFFFLVARHRILRERPIVLLCAVAVPDMMYGTQNLVFMILRFLRDEPVPYGRASCQIFGALTVFPIVGSVQTYALIAYDRYTAFVTRCIH